MPERRATGDAAPPHSQSLPVGVMDEEEEDIAQEEEEDSKEEEEEEEEEADDDPELIADGEQSTQIPPVSREHEETIHSSASE